MTGINHAVAGALIAAAVPHPELALPMALASHFILDSLPHFGGAKDLKEFLKVYSVDSLLVIVFLLSLILARPNHWPLMIICALLAMSPDIMWIPNALRTLRQEPRKRLNAVMRFHKNIQWGERRWGLAIEVPWLIIFSCILIAVDK